jgi:ribulose-5-phosphate 4-epimerase/fuculose-1-phosphate aldolase
VIHSTYTFAKLPVSAATFAEVADKLKRAGYDHAFMVEDRVPLIDMHGIALTPEEKDKSDDARIDDHSDCLELARQIIATYEHTKYASADYAEKACAEVIRQRQFRKGDAPSGQG